jgi:prolyl 4-hydroxylase
MIYLIILILVFVIFTICIILINSNAIYEYKEYNDFLSNEECDELIKISETKLIDSLVYDSAQGSKDVKARVSQQCWLKDIENPVVKKISDKTSQILNLPQNYQEQLQVVKYQTGGFFKPHYDACVGDEKYCKSLVSNSTNRYATLLIYLNDDYNGGETQFPLLNKHVVPKKGKAVLFFNTDTSGTLLDKSLHGGNPVTSGTKWVCNKWVRLAKY